MAFCYILQCADGCYYVGSTGDLDARLVKHLEGSGSKYTAARRPAILVFAEEFTTIEGARARERQLKGWTRAKKEALIAGDMAALKRA